MPAVDGLLLKLFIGESDKHEGIPLYEWIVKEAKAHGLAGATVLRGIQGFGAGSRIHSTKILDLATDLPLIVEIVDETQKIEQFLPVLHAAISDGALTVQNVQLFCNRS